MKPLLILTLFSLSLGMGQTSVEVIQDTLHLKPRDCLSGLAAKWREYEAECRRDTLRLSGWYRSYWYTPREGDVVKFHLTDTSANGWLYRGDGAVQRIYEWNDDWFKGAKPTYETKEPPKPTFPDFIRWIERKRKP